MKKNAQSVEAWLEAMIAVARYYRLDFSQENVRATVNWERDSKREELLTDMARQLGMGLRLVEFSADSLNPWRLPLIAVFDNQQIGVITRRDNHDNISVQFSGDEGLETTLNVTDIEDNIVELALLRPLSAIPDARVDDYIRPYQANWFWSLSLKDWRRYGDIMLASLVEAVQSIEDIKLLRAEQRFQNQWNHTNDVASSISMKQRFLTGLLLTWTQEVQSIVYVVVLLVGCFMVMNGDMTTGALVGTTILASCTIAPLSQISGVLSRWQQAKVARNGLDELMKRPVDQPEHGKLVHKAVLHGNYQFSNAIFYYDEEEKIADVAIGKLNIQAGEKIAILGRNGAGKSTLLQMLAGMRIAQQGQVLLDNISIGQLDPADLRRDMGLLSQTGRLFFGSLRENLTMGMPEASDEDIERALTLSGALPFVQKQKNGLNYMIQEGGFGLSGGQRQTLLLARLLISQPNIVLLDEPSASLDEMAEAHLIEQLKQWIGHRTLIIATHRTAMLQLVDRIIVMDQGRIVMDGAKEAILREQGEPTTRRVVLQEKNKGSAA